MANLSNETVERIKTSLFAGAKIEAIKIYREATNSGLAEAKSEVEAIESRLRQESPNLFTAKEVSPFGCLVFLAAIALIGAIIYIVLQWQK